MSEPTKLVSRTESGLTEVKPHELEDAKQRRLMVVALALLLVTLVVVLYWDREFWFPGTYEADSEQPAETTPAASAPARPAPVATNSVSAAGTKSKRHTTNKTDASKSATKSPSPTPAAAAPPVAATATTNRTVLPPLEVEVVAGDNHRTVRPGSNSVRVDLQPGTPPQNTSEVSGISETAANVTNNASERVQMSADTSAVVSRSVRPGYPLLARQMKVQGSVILQALISKEGSIQGLQVVSGPPILATAAQDAVKQWHFKPHLQNNEPVETQAKITVNFTISTN